MVSINWNDVNVLRKLPDGWYSVPSDSEYGKMIIRDPDIKFNDSVKKAKERHNVVLKKEKEIDEFIKSETLRDVPCDHKNYSYKGHLICAVCGLTKRDFDLFAFNEGDEGRVHVTSKKSEKALLWRYLQIKRKPMTMLEFSKKIKMDRMTASLIVRRLDDYKNFKFNKRGRPKRK